MKPENVPMSEKILPGDICDLCRTRLEIIFEAGDEEYTVYVACPNSEGGDNHTEHNGVPRDWLRVWGWAVD